MSWTGSVMACKGEGGGRGADELDRVRDGLQRRVSGHTIR